MDRLEAASVDRWLAELGLEPVDRDERDGEAARRLGCPYLLLARRPAGERQIGGLDELLGTLPDL